MVRSLDTKWKEFLYAFTGFGPNFLMVIMGAYFTDAINPAALPSDSFQAIMGGTCFILPAIFPILYAISKVFDGIIDIPFAHVTDTLSTKWGRRRPAIAVCMVPMVLSYAMCWIPIGGADGRLLNTVWVFIWSLIFFSTYTMCLISFYGSLSTTCSDELQRLRVSSYKSFFDTISYCLAYALVPLLLDMLKLNIDDFIFICMPLMVTITIPLFLIKEGEKYGYPENAGLSSEKISILQSIGLTFKNRLFRNWLIVRACMTVGLQMFLVGMNAMIVGGMGFSGAEMAIVNTCAFAPVPIMLYLFGKLKAKRGVRFSFQTCLLCFALAIFSFFLASTFILGENNKTLQYLIAGGGGIIGSWAIGSFFMMPIMVPSQISAVEEKLTGKNHSAMYFAGEAVVSSVVGAISSSLIYENIKMLFINKANGEIVWAESIEDASAALNAQGTVYNLGTLMVPFIVFAACFAGFLFAFRMPKDYSVEIVAKDFKADDPSIDLSKVMKDKTLGTVPEKGETLFVQIGLWVLSGTIFGFIWAAFLLNSIKEICKKKALPSYLLACLIPFAGGFIMADKNKQLAEAAKECGIDMKSNSALHIILGFILPILPINLVSLIITQHRVNQIYTKQNKVTAENE